MLRSYLGKVEQVAKCGPSPYTGNTPRASLRAEVTAADAYDICLSATLPRACTSEPALKRFGATFVDGIAACGPTKQVMESFQAMATPQSSRLTNSDNLRDYERLGDG